MRYEGFTGAYSCLSILLPQQCCNRVAHNSNNSSRFNTEFTDLVTDLRIYNCFLLFTLKKDMQRSNRCQVQALRIVREHSRQSMFSHKSVGTLILTCIMRHASIYFPVDTMVEWNNVESSCLGQCSNHLAIMSHIHILIYKETTHCSHSQSVQACTWLCRGVPRMF